MSRGDLRGLGWGVFLTANNAVVNEVLLFCAFHAWWSGCGVQPITPEADMDHHIMKKPASLFKGCESQDDSEEETTTKRIARLEDEKAGLIESVIKMKEESIQARRQQDQRTLAIVSEYELIKRDDPLGEEDTKRTLLNTLVLIAVRR